MLPKKHIYCLFFFIINCEFLRASTKIIHQIFPSFSGSSHTLYSSEFNPWLRLRNWPPSRTSMRSLYHHFTIMCTKGSNITTDTRHFSCLSLRALLLLFLVFFSKTQPIANVLCGYVTVSHSRQQTTLPCLCWNIYCREQKQISLCHKTPFKRSTGVREMNTNCIHAFNRCLQ